MTLLRLKLPPFYKFKLSKPSLVVRGLHARAVGWSSAALAVLCLTWYRDTDCFLGWCVWGCGAVPKPVGSVPALRSGVCTVLFRSRVCLVRSFACLKHLSNTLGTAH